MTVRIVTDSTCDIPDELVAEHGITVIPMYINMGGEGYLDGVEITRAEFYQRLPASNPAPTTGVPSQEAFRRVYKRLEQEGATGILSIHVSSSLSAVVDVARTTAEGTSAVPLTVYDSGQLSLGTGFMALEAAKAAAEGSDMESILSVLDERAQRTHVFAALETLEYLRRGGRMNSALAGIGEILRIKPLIRMFDGVSTIERVRTTSRAQGRMIDILHDLAPFEEMAILHAASPAKAESLREWVRHLLPDGHVPSVEITPIIGAHVGPGAVGFACVSKRAG